VFEGGGVKGIAYIGAMQVLAQRNCWYMCGGLLSCPKIGLVFSWLATS
jgi:predicted acylesterase/phospholipase RssA